MMFAIIGSLIGMPLGYILGIIAAEELVKAQSYFKWVFAILSVSIALVFLAAVFFGENLFLLSGVVALLLSFFNIRLKKKILHFLVFLAYAGIAILINDEVFSFIASTILLIAFVLIGSELRMGHEIKKRS